MGTRKDEGKGSLEHMVLSNSLALIALLELMEERGLIQQADVVARMKEIKSRESPLSLDRLN